jgi:hypothetical protein
MVRLRSGRLYNRVPGSEEEESADKTGEQADAARCIPRAAT